MLTLKNWFLTMSYTGHVHAHGQSEGHYRFADGTDIHTSRIETCYQKGEGEYICVTHSGSPYHLSEREMDGEQRKESLELLRTLEMLPGDGGEARTEIAFSEMEFAKKGKAYGEQMEAYEQRVKVARKKAEEYAKERLQDGELYLLIDDMEVLEAICRFDGVVRRVGAQVHVGMFQDSVLVTDWEQGKVDFRYFPNWKMEPYHWSDGLENLYIHNAGAGDFYFQGSHGDILCRAGEVVKIGKDRYEGEGLFSPDAVNGKCMLSKMVEEAAAGADGSDGAEGGDGTDGSEDPGQE